MMRFFKRARPPVNESPRDAWIRRAREFDWVPSLLVRRIGEMDGATAHLIMAEPERFDTLSVRAAMEVQACSL